MILYTFYIYYCYNIKCYKFQANIGKICLRFLEMIPGIVFFNYYNTIVLTTDNFKWTTYIFFS